MVIHDSPHFMRPTKAKLSPLNFQKVDHLPSIESRKQLEKSRSLSMLSKDQEMRQISLKIMKSRAEFEKSRFKEDSEFLKRLNV